MTAQVNSRRGAEVDSRRALVQDLLLFAIACLALLPGAVLGRLHDDEVIYWDVARHISQGLGPVSQVSGGYFVWHLPLPAYLTAPVLWLFDDLLALRCVAVLMTAAAVPAIRRVGDDFGRGAGWLAGLLFIGSFHTLRYGFRFYFDPFGLCFFWWGLVALRRGHGLGAGFLLATAVLCRQLWAVPVAALGLSHLWGNRHDLRKAVPLLVGGGCTAATALLWVGLVPGFQDFFMRGAVVQGVVARAEYAAPSLVGQLGRVGRAWAELLLAHGLAFAGVVLVVAVGWRRHERWRRLLLPPAQHLFVALAGLALVLTFTPGFQTNGGFTQYGLAITGFLAVIGGAGIAAVSTRLASAQVASAQVASARWLSVAMALLLVAQVTGYQWAGTRVAEYSSRGVYGASYQDDLAVIAYLTERAAGQRIVGVHGAFVPGASWFWVERHMDRLPALHPDWVVTYRQWLTVNPDDTVQVTAIGPYVIVQVKSQAAFGTAIQTDTDKPQFRL